MSRKKITNNRLLGLIAFVSLLMSGICYVLDKLNVGNGILPTIAYAFLLIVVLWTAWDFAKDLSAGWKIVYYVLAVLAIGGFIFGGFQI